MLQMRKGLDVKKIQLVVRLTLATLLATTSANALAQTAAPAAAQADETVGDGDDIVVTGRAGSGDRTKLETS